jgi:acyl-CoA thioesterase
MSATGAEFALDSAVTPVGGGLYTAEARGSWFGPIALNGGFLAALVVRAMSAELAAPERGPRSLTIHFLRPPAEGPLELAVQVERSGRGASTLTGRVIQEGRLMALALGTWSESYPAALGWEPPAPAVPAPEQLPPVDLGPSAPRMFRQFDVRHVFGPPPFGGGDDALAGGWIRTRAPEPLDDALVALLADAWFPSAFARLTAPSPAPTIDLTIHFRSRPPAGEHPWVLGRYSSRAAIDGLFEEDAELWSADGRLLAQSRQLALLPLAGS